MDFPQDKPLNIIREGVCLLGGVVAVLMQVAHPKLALAASEHSNFHEDVWARIDSTVTYVYVALLGTAEEGEILAKSVKARHRSVTGGEKELSYAASHADLLLWVNATVYSGMINVHERVFGTMDTDMADRVLQKFGRLGALLTVDEDPWEWPDSREKFTDYWHKMCTSLAIHPTESKKLQATFFNIQKHVPWPSKILFVVAMPFLRAFATMSLPDQIRKQYDLKPTRSTRALDSVVGFLMRKVYPHLPFRLRQWPSEYMLGRARSRKSFQQGGN
ncbi:hypothetical protein N7476_005078 [Penicillium atrosanguineum]|uniref:ER-bound oxygenase mpaB/mpaB'/Rubber oxygenase catalytic domain-containing protein n=1 Tax=Penicillium atrosanguineum TaxID=1132637 RepID=A0A9W9U5A0_9EURO|nr:hypothetical protein N7476_005078 [Penicillium atrosanguineum]